MGDMDLASCHVDLAHRLVWRDGGSVQLTVAEARPLAYLAENPGRAVSNEELLERVWGYRKGVRSRTVVTTVWRLREKIESDPANPVHMLTVFGTGYRFEPPSAPPPEGRFFGRTEELGRLRAGGSIVTIVGPAGVGKTRLAREWLDAEPGLFVDLSTATGSDAIVCRVAAAMRIHLSPCQADVEVVGDALRTQGVARIVLDNVEQVVGGAGATIGPWAAAAPATRFVVTSREALRLEGEHVIALEPLPEEDAIALLVDRGRRVRPGGRFDDRATLRAVVDRLERLPLALELASVRLAVMSPAELLARLDDRLGVLRPLRSVGRTLDEAIARSWELLDEGEREVLVQLAMFRGAFTLEAAEAVLAPGASAADALDRLCARSLVHATEAADGSLRFALYDAVRAFVLPKLGPEVGDRHAAWYAVTAPADVERAFAGGDALAAISETLDNVIAGFRHAASRDPLLATRLARIADSVLHRTGPLSTGLQLLGDALEIPGVSPGDRAELLACRARLHRLTGRYDAAEIDIREAMACCEAPGTASSTVSLVYRTWGSIALETGRALAAIEACDVALRHVGDDATQAAMAMVNRGSALRYPGRFDEAVADCARGAQVVARIDRHTLATILNNHGGLELDLGRLDRALPLLLRAARVLEELGGQDGALALTLGNLAHLYAEQGELAQAREHLERARARIPVVGDSRAVAALTLTEATIAQEA